MDAEELEAVAQIVLHHYDRPNSIWFEGKEKPEWTPDILLVQDADVLDHFGVRITDHEGGDLFLDPSHAFIEAIPGVPHEGALITFDRARALSREDIPFVSRDHPLVRDMLA